MYKKSPCGGLKEKKRGRDDAALLCTIAKDIFLAVYLDSIAGAKAKVFPLLDKLNHPLLKINLGDSGRGYFYLLNASIWTNEYPDYHLAGNAGIKLEIIVIACLDLVVVRVHDQRGFGCISYCAACQGGVALEFESIRRLKAA